MSPFRQALVAQWISLWGRFVLLLAGARLPLTRAPPCRSLHASLRALPPPLGCRACSPPCIHLTLLQVSGASSAAAGTTCAPPRRAGEIPAANTTELSLPCAALGFAALPAAQPPSSCASIFSLPAAHLISLRAGPSSCSTTLLMWTPQSWPLSSPPAASRKRAWRASRSSVRGRCCAAAPSFPSPARPDALLPLLASEARCWRARP